MAAFFDEYAEDYDEDIYPLNEKEFILPTIKVLCELAPGPAILELAVGTGRIALPLAEKGFQVTGVDLSERMLQVLKSKKGGPQVETVLGDMSQIDLHQEFDLVYLVFNGITYLLSQEEQIACFQNVSRHLKPGGIFVIETFLPKLEKILPDGTVPYALEKEYIGFDKYDQLHQLLTSYQFDLSGDKIQSQQTKHRYVWPSEMQLMAKLAGLESLQQWSDWQKTPLSSSADNCIMVWRKPQ